MHDLRMLVLEEVGKLNKKLGKELFSDAGREAFKTPSNRGMYFSLICRIINKNLSKQFQGLSPAQVGPLLKAIGLQDPRNVTDEAQPMVLKAKPNTDGPWLASETLRKCWDKLPNLANVMRLLIFTDFDHYLDHPEQLGSDAEAYRQKWKAQAYDQRIHIRLRKLVGDYAFYLVPAPNSRHRASRAVLRIGLKGQLLTMVKGGRTTNYPVALDFNKGKLPIMSIVGSKQLKMTCHPFEEGAKGMEGSFFWVLGMKLASNSPFIYIGKCEVLKNGLPPLEIVTSRLWPRMPDLNKMWRDRAPLPTYPSTIENKEAHKLLEGHYNGFGHDETTTAMESTCYYISNYIFKEGRIRVFSRVLGSEVLYEALGTYFVVDRYYVIYLFPEGFVCTGIATIPTNGDVDHLEIAYSGHLEDGSPTVFSGLVICEKVPSVHELLKPCRELPHLDGDTLRIAGDPSIPDGTPQEYRKKLKELPTERLRKIKQLETLLRYRSLPILCRGLPRSFHTGTWMGTASGSDARGMPHGDGEERDYWLTINLSFMDSFSYLDGYLTITGGDPRETRSKGGGIITWKLMAKGRENGTLIHYSCLAFMPDKKLKPPFFLLGSSLLQLDGQKAEGNYLFQHRNEWDGTCGQEQGTFLLERLDEEGRRQGNLLRLHCNRLRQHFPRQGAYCFREYNGRGY